MFKNTLIGLSKVEKEMFDAVCKHLNGCMTRMGLRNLDGEEDQILIDLWMDSFPHKVDADGNPVMRTIKETHWATVNGEYKQVVKEKQVKELDFTSSLIGTTSIGIYKWRGEQLLINKRKYLFGDKRVRKLSVDKKALTESVVDAWGNERVRAVWEDALDLTRVSKRDLSMKVNECELARDGEDPMTLDMVAGTVEGGYESVLLRVSLSSVCNESEMGVLEKLSAGDSLNQVYKDLAASVKWTSRNTDTLRQKVSSILKPELNKAFC